MIFGNRMLFKFGRNQLMEQLFNVTFLILAFSHFENNVLIMRG